MVGTSNEFVFLAGMPRSGSTVLSSLLHQNPRIHAEGMSAVCQLMWDMNVSCRDNAMEAIYAANRQKTIIDLISSIPKIYYSNVTKPVIVDKNRGWCHPLNVEMIRRFIDPNPRIIVLDRSLDEVVESIIKLGKKNGVEIPEKLLREPNTNPIMRSYENVQLAKSNNNGEFLFINYSDLIADPHGVVAEIYDFCNWRFFDHNFSNIQASFQENSDIYLLKGLHEVRPLESAQV